MHASYDGLVLPPPNMRAMIHASNDPPSLFRDFVLRCLRTKFGVLKPNRSRHPTHKNVYSAFFSFSRLRLPLLTIEKWGVGLGGGA